VGDDVLEFPGFFRSFVKYFLQVNEVSTHPTVVWTNFQ
jgi:hypothetical protein